MVIISTNSLTFMVALLRSFSPLNLSISLPRRSETSSLAFHPSALLLAFPYARLALPARLSTRPATISSVRPTATAADSSHAVGLKLPPASEARSQRTRSTASDQIFPICSSAPLENPSVRRFSPLWFSISAAAAIVELSWNRGNIFEEFKVRFLPPYYCS